ncbi:MAG: hypothetical protein NTV44_04390, partial [Firmicutes bacterium]|nr:hypothetical protein [Bacillota bacterium]
DIPRPGIPESFKVLQRELQGLSMDVKLLDSDGEEIDMDALAKEDVAEERKINSTIRALTGETVVEQTEGMHEVNPNE